MNQVPYDADAETSLLGAMLLSREAIEIGIQTLISTDFYTPRHGRIFDAIAALYRDGRPSDPITVAAVLDADASMTTDEGGWKPVLLRLQAETPSSANAAAYAEIIQERADRRRLLASASELQGLACDLATPLDDIVETTRANLDNVTRAGGIRIHPNFETWAADVDLNEAWLIPEVLERRDRVMVVAAEGFGKSYLLRQWALMGACGVHWFAESPIRPFRTLVVDVENSDRQIVRNTAQLYRTAQRISPGFDPDNYVIVPFATLDLTKRSNRLEVESLIAGHRPDLIVIGPLYKILPPPSKGFGFEEQAMTGARVIDDWRARYDCAVLMEHHAPKGSGGQRELDPLGSGAWLRWPEFGLSFSPNPEDPSGAKLGHFRGQREWRNWPATLRRGTRGTWGWRAPAEYEIEETF